MRPVPSDEQETTINLSRNEPTLTVYSSDSVWIARLDRLAAKNPAEVTVTQKDEFGKFYTMPKKYLSLKAPRKMSDEERQRRIEQLDRMRGFSKTAPISQEFSDTTGQTR